LVSGRENHYKRRCARASIPGAPYTLLFLPQELTLSRRQHDRRRRRGHGPNGTPAAPRITLTQDGVPAATPDATPVSAVVFVSDESRARYPWLPGRVIAWSVWRGPDHVRVQIDVSGNAVPCAGRRILARVA
jgi:hypothetical protein